MRSLQDLQKKFTKEEINALPLRRYEGAILIPATEEELDRAFEALARETVLGFDTETQPCFKKGGSNPTALVQLATADEVYIFQFTRIHFPQRLADILADPGKIKAGVAVDDDVSSLRKLKEFEPASFVDLGEASRRHNLMTNGLRTLAANLLGVRISKTARSSNWGKPSLTDKQIIYAATDAWVSRELYLRMHELELC